MIRRFTFATDVFYCIRYDFCDITLILRSTFNLRRIVHPTNLQFVDCYLKFRFLKYSIFPIKNALKYCCADYRNGSVFEVSTRIRIFKRSNN